MYKYIVNCAVLLACLCGVNTVYATPTASLHQNMAVLIVGGGGREHAMAWKIANSPWKPRVFVAPGNAGTALEPRVQNVNIKANDIEALKQFALEQQIDLTIVGPEQPLASGIVDTFNAAGLHCFGPTRAAARLESSKIFSKEFMQRHKIPTARYASFSDFEAAKSYVQKHGTPIVIKADGLASGKGVVVAHSEQEALDFLKSLLIDGAHNNAGKKVLIEEYLQGEELSYIVASDGTHIISLDTSQDHKQLYAHDKGPNTGGMGAYSPVNIVTPKINKIIMKTIVEPTIRGMATEKTPYTGFLYIGLMMTKDGPKVLEYNCRLGDPEAQALLLRLKSDLLELCSSTVNKSLNHMSLQWDKRSAICVVIASTHYPNSSTEKTVLSIQPSIACEDCKIFHSSTKQQGEAFIADSGRILSVGSLGTTLGEAQAKAYAEIQQNMWSKVQYRADIGYRELEREEHMFQL